MLKNSATDCNEITIGCVRKHAYCEDAFIKELISSRNTVFKLSEGDEDYHIVHDNLSDMAKVTSGLTYQKGAWFLNMLSNYIGEKAFHKGIRDYYHRFFNSNATTVDLRKDFERASGKDLSRFFSQWLYQGGNIKLKGNWMYDAKNKIVVIELQQVLPEQYIFNMPVEIGIRKGDSSKQQIEVIQLNKRKIKVSFPCQTLPAKVELDPGTKLLAQWDFSRAE